MYGIKFPIGMGTGRGDLSNSQQIPAIPPAQGQRPGRPVMMNKLELIGFGPGGRRKSEVVNRNEAGGIMVTVKDDPYGGMQYEARIPLERILTDPATFLSIL